MRLIVICIIGHDARQRQIGFLAYSDTSQEQIRLEWRSSHAQFIMQIL